MQFIEGKETLIKPKTDIERDGKLIAVIGKQGAGKSLTMTYLGAIRQAQGDVIYSNYHLYGGFEYYYLENKDDVIRNLINIQNSTILADEFHYYIDAYNWHEKKVIEYVKTQMVLARRKGNYFIMGNQLKMQFPFRLREIIPIWIIPYIAKWEKTRNEKGEKTRIPKVVKFYKVDKDNNQSKLYSFRAKLILNYYNTYESFEHIILENEIEEELKEKAKKDKKTAEEEAVSFLK